MASPAARRPRLARRKNGGAGVQDLDAVPEPDPEPEVRPSDPEDSDVEMLYSHPWRACNERRSTIVTRQVTKMLGNSKGTLPSFCGAFPDHTHSKRLKNNKFAKSDQDKKMDTNMFESYLEYMWNSFPEDNTRSSMYIDSLWFSLYKDESQKAKVLDWIRSRQIFSQRYIFVPIVCWRHWSLLILCNLDETSRSQSKQPCMLLLDSLQRTDPKRLEPDIRRFIIDIYTSEGMERCKQLVAAIPLLIPKVPQQTNGDECGMYVLYFIKRFLYSNLEQLQFNPQGYIHHLTNDWFNPEDLDNFRKEINSFLMGKSTVDVE